MKTVFRLLFLLLAAAASSCVFPTHLADENPYGSKSIGFIVLNETSRTAVSTTLGAPVRVFSDGRWWLYQSDRRMTEWFWFIATPGGADGGEFGGDNRIYSLIIEFGNDDIVSNLTVVTDQRPCSKDEVICYVDSKLIAVHESTRATQTYRDESSNAPVSDVLLQAFRSEETRRFSATSESGDKVELVERGHLVLDARSMKPYTGHITQSHDDIVGKSSYEAGTLHGPVVVRGKDGTILWEACFEHGTMLDSAEDRCKW